MLRLQPGSPKNISKREHKQKHVQNEKAKTTQKDNTKKKGQKTKTNNMNNQKTKIILYNIFLNQMYKIHNNINSQQKIKFIKPFIQ